MQYQPKHITIKFYVDSQEVTVNIALRDSYGPKTVPACMLSRAGEAFSPTDVTVTWA